MDWSLSKLIRIENGSVGISTNDLKVLLGHYGIADNDKVEELIALAKAGRERSWWSQYRDVASPQLVQFIEYQAAAMITRNFEPVLVPGLLQTEAYARVVIEEFSGHPSKERLDDLVELRMKRQELLKRTGPPPWSFFILDEAVLRRRVGSQDVMDAQIRHLIGLTGRPDVTIEVVPFSAGINRGMHRPFVILEFPEPEDEDVLYLESSGGEVFHRDDQEEIVTYREIFEELRKMSLGGKTVDFLRGLLGER